MLGYEEIYEYFFDNIKKLFYPEEWIALDLSISKSELLALLFVDKHGEIIMSQMADFMNVPMSTTTGIVERLVKNNYIKRERSESDRRIVVVHLTDQGKGLVDRLKFTAKEYLQLVLNSLTEEEKSVLSTIFIKVIDIINKKASQNEKATVEDIKMRRIEIE